MPSNYYSSLKRFITFFMKHKTMIYRNKREQENANLFLNIIKITIKSLVELKILIQRKKLSLSY